MFVQLSHCSWESDLTREPAQLRHADGDVFELVECMVLWSCSQQHCRVAVFKAPELTLAVLSAFSDAIACLVSLLLTHQEVRDNVKLSIDNTARLFEVSRAVPIELACQGTQSRKDA